MFDKLKALFSHGLEREAITGEERMRLACAALMMEVATIDDHFSIDESSALQHLLSEQFTLSKSDSERLQQRAKDARHDATSLYEFTRDINEHCSIEEKFDLIRAMWQVAFADGHLDKYEEHIIRRAADLIHVNHSDFIRAKLSAKNEQPLKP